MREHSFDELKIGDSAEFSKTVTESDVNTFAGITGDFNPVHVNNEYAEKSMFKGRIAHGMLTAGFISTVLGTELPGPNSIYLGQELKFLLPVKIGDTVTARATITEKRDEKRILKLETIVFNQKGEKVVDGIATIKKIGM
jgi:3-hydroxybutyryl-CoA dehydratase